MAAYATCEDVEKGYRELTEDEQEKATALLDEAAIIIDAYIIDAYASPAAEIEAKKVVSCRMVRRAMGDETGLQIPMGASQGTVSGLGYSQSFTYGTGASGELYLTKQDKKLLGVSGQIGSYSPVEDLNV